MCVLKILWLQNQLDFNIKNTWKEWKHENIFHSVFLGNHSQFRTNFLEKYSFSIIRIIVLWEQQY